ncbi:MAG: host specificity factor TipJ family phage tail protein [Cypionkella sp.]
MRASVVTVRNPFDPLDRTAMDLRRPVKVRRLAPRGRPVVAILNGRPMMRTEWRRKVRHGDHLAFIILPEGGGGGGGGSNPLQAILSLALLAVVPWAVGFLGPAFTTAAGGFTLLGQVTVAGVTLAGQALISALIPVRTTGAMSLPAPSPTYSLTAQGNTARLEQPIPDQYGRMRFAPDFAAQPYTEFAGSDQYLYQLLCLGVGEFAVEDVLIDDTDISNFAEITTEIVAPGAQVTLFPTAVTSSAEVGGQELLGMKAATYAQAGTTITVTETGHGRATGQAVALDFTTGTAVDAVLTIATTPTADTYTLTAASLTTSGNVNVRSVMGGATGFVSCGSGKVASRLAIDVILSRGLFNSSGSTLSDKTLSFTVEAQQIDDIGVAIGGWLTLGTETITDHTTTPVRKSISYTLATAGRYAVRAYRTDTKDTASTVGHEVLWSGLRAYLQEPKSYGPVTLLAMRMKATNNLTLQASRLVRVTATRKLPVWNGSVWSAPVATRSIAWAIADAARNATYGGNLPDAQIDLAALLALDAIWTARGDYFDGRFDQSSTFWDAALRLCAAGRAKPFMQGGILRVVRDGPASIPVAMFSMRNIIRGSFSIDLLQPTADTADAVSASYFDGTTWTAQRITASLAGSSAKPVKVEVFGITQRAQMMREGLYLAACNKYRRRIAKFSTEMEGFVPSIGDLIAIQHDMPGWGAQAEAVAWDAAALTLTLTEPMSFGTGTYYAGLRRKDGSMSGPWAVKKSKASAYQIIFTAAPDYTPYTGSDFERTHVVFGLGSTWSALAKVLSIKPKSAYQVQIEAILDDNSVHTADSGSIAAPISFSSLPKVLTRPVIKPFIARLDPNDANRVLLSWEPVPGADSYHVEMAEGNDPSTYTGSWTRVADTTASTFTISILSPFRTMIRIRAVGVATGDWTAAALGSLLGRFWNINGSVAVWTTGSAAFWRPL